MIPKAIRYSDHAVQRRLLRGIKRSEVRWLLAKGDRRKAETRGGEQRWESQGYLGKREALLVFFERAHEYEIITVQWLDERKRRE